MELDEKRAALEAEVKKPMGLSRSVKKGVSRTWDHTGASRTLHTLHTRYSRTWGHTGAHRRAHSNP